MLYRKKEKVGGCFRAFQVTRETLDCKSSWPLWVEETFRKGGGTEARGFLCKGYDDRLYIKHPNPEELLEEGDGDRSFG